MQKVSGFLGEIQQKVHKRMNKTERSDLMKAYKRFKKARDVEKAFACMRLIYEGTKEYDIVKDFRKWILYCFKADEKILKISKMCYCLTGKDNFIDYMIAMEWERSWEQKFYLPREEALKPIATEMMNLEKGEYDILCISAPPGIGKTGLGDFFMTWVAGRHPELAMLMGSHSNSILNDNYNECIRMCDSEDYCWQDIFVGHRVVRTNAADLKIDIDKPKKFSTFQFGSLGGSLAGRVRAMSLLYLDDLVANSEIALNKERMDKVFSQFQSDYLQRMQGNTKILLIMTRWSIYDVIGRLEAEHENDPRFKVINIPAMDDNDRSNFDYGGTIGFSTQYYKRLRESMDSYMWNALYMGRPMERDSMLFPLPELRYYFELPSQDPDAIISVVDTKDHGTDDCVMPIAYRYGNDYYIEELMCDSSTPDITIPRIAQLLKDHKVDQCRFESNVAGGQIARDVDKKLKENGGRTSISTKYTTANKETRIIVNSGWIKAHCLFKEEIKQGQEYRKAMNLLGTFSHVSKKKKDDVPDALSMLADFANSFETNVITVRSRIF